MITQVKVISDDGIERFIMHRDIRSKHPKTYQIARLTLAEAKELKSGDHVLFITRYGTLANAKVTSIKTWKTRPGDCSIGLKYGLYEYFSATYYDGIATSEELVRIIDG